MRWHFVTLKRVSVCYKNQSKYCECKNNLYITALMVAYFFDTVMGKSASHVVGCEFVPQLDHTKNHHYNEMR